MLSRKRSSSGTHDQQHAASGGARECDICQHQVEHSLVTPEAADEQSSGTVSSILSSALTALRASGSGLKHRMSTPLMEPSHRTADFSTWTTPSASLKKFSATDYPPEPSWQPLQSVYPCTLATSGRDHSACDPHPDSKSVDTTRHFGKEKNRLWPLAGFWRH